MAKREGEINLSFLSQFNHVRESSPPSVFETAKSPKHHRHQTVFVCPNMDGFLGEKQFFMLRQNRVLKRYFYTRFRSNQVDLLAAADDFGKVRLFEYPCVQNKVNLLKKYFLIELTLLETIFKICPHAKVYSPYIALMNWQHTH